MTTLSFAESLGVSLLGFAIVFFVLVVLMGVIRLLRLIMDKLEAPALQVAADTAPAPAAVSVPASCAQNEVKLYGLDEKTAAMIMAIVADETKIPLNELRFIAIKEKAPERK